MATPDKTKEQGDNNRTMLKISKGLLEVYEPPFATISTHLRELIEKQDDVLSKMTAERRCVNDLQHDAELDTLIENVATSKQRLTVISGSMTELHKKMQILRIRTENIERASQQKARKQTVG